MFFKVTNLDNRSLYGDAFPKFRVQYSTEYFAKPKIGKLYCYNFQCTKTDYYTGKPYLPEYNLNATRRLWLCECLNPVSSDSTEVFGLQYVQRFLSEGVLPTFISHETHTITAVLADAIKLVREVSQEEFEALYAEYKKGR